MSEQPTLVEKMRSLALREPSHAAELQRLASKLEEAIEGHDAKKLLGA